VIGLGGTAHLIRTMRATLLDELRKPYVQTARAKGVEEWELLRTYPVRVALVPIAATVGWALPAIFSGSVIVGIVLNLPTTPFGLDISTRHWLYYQAWGAAAVLFVAAWLMTRGRLGRAWRSVRDGEIAATASGVNGGLYKTLAFGVSSFYAGVAGALLAIEVSYVNPDTFPLTLSILLLASVVVGGLGSLSGVIVGALMLEFLPIYAQDPPLVPVAFSKQSPAVAFGALLILIMFLIPEGVAGLLRRMLRPFTNALVRRQNVGSPIPATPAGREEL